MGEKTVSNLVIRITLDASEDVLGLNGLKSVLNFGGISNLLENKPDYSFTKDFTDEDLRALTGSYINIIGIDGARSLLRLIGRGLGNKSIDLGVFDSFKDLPSAERLLKSVELYCIASGRGTVTKKGDIIVYDNPQCTTCVGVKHTHPICNMNTGFIDSLVLWSGIKDMRTVETECMATSGKTCRFEVLPIN
jgi:predicted hydrocarbon binding protein